MRKPTLLLAGAIALFIAWALFSATTNALGFVVVTPYEADVNKSGTVNAIDLMQVAMKFGQPVPTMTPSPLWQPWNREKMSRGGHMGRRAPLL